MNWQTIGDKAQVTKANNWIFASIVIAIASLFVNFIGVIYIIIWYFLWQRKQTQYLRHHFYRSYKKKGWLKPVFSACACWLFFIVAIVVISFIRETS